MQMLCKRSFTLERKVSKLCTFKEISHNENREHCLILFCLGCCRSVAKIKSDSLQPHGLQHARLPGPSWSPSACSSSCPLSRWCNPTISASVAPFSLCPQSFPATGSYPVSQFFASGGQRIAALASASILLMNIQGWFPLGLTGLISLQSKGLSRVFSNTTIWKHQFFSTQLSLQLNSYIHTWLLENHSFDQTSLCWQSNVSAF